MKRLLRLSLIAALAAPVSAAGKGPGATLIADRTLDAVPNSSGELLYLNPFILPGEPRQFHRSPPPPRHEAATVTGCRREFDWTPRGRVKRLEGRTVPLSPLSGLKPSSHP